MSDSDVSMQLLQRRIVLLTGALDVERATTALGQLLLLDGDNGRPIRLHLSCSDAELDAAIMLAETIDLVRADVNVLATGVVAGPAVGVVAAAHRREAHPQVMFLLREPRTGMSGTATHLAGEADQHRRQLVHLHQRIADATGHPVAKVESDMRAGVALTAPEAVDYGLLHAIRG
jgi:ATP-dependent Clp protease protease subunit